MKAAIKLKPVRVEKAQDLQRKMDPEAKMGSQREVEMQVQVTTPQSKNMISLVASRVRDIRVGRNVLNTRSLTGLIGRGASGVSEAELWERMPNQSHWK